MHNLYSRFRLKLLFCALIFTLPALACGVQTATEPPQMFASVGNSYQAPSPSEAPAPDGGQWMTVTASEAVYIRPSAGTGEQPIGDLKNGAVVFVTGVKVVGDSLWCRHLSGWTNCRYLAAE